MAPGSSFTGRQRQRRTRWTVRASDWAARAVITVGGIGAIVAISLVGISLVGVAAPLFSSAKVQPAVRVESLTGPPSTTATAPVRVEIDEYQTLGWSLSSSGSLRVFRVNDGATIDEPTLTDGQPPSAVAAFPNQGVVALGFADGTVRLVRVRFVTEFVRDDEIPEPARALEAGASLLRDGALLEKTAQGAIRRQSVVVAPQPALELGTSPIRLIDLSPRSDGPLAAVLSEDGAVRLIELSDKENLITGEKQLALEAEHSLKTEPPAAGADRGLPTFVRLTGRGDNLFLVWADGTAQRYDTRRLDQPRLAETVRLIPADNASAAARVTAIEPLLGRNTLLVGDSRGALAGWFLVRHTDADGNETQQFTRTKPLVDAGPAITSIASSRRTRLTVAGDAEGRVRVFHVTSGRELTTVSTGGGGPARNVLIAPKDDGLFALADGGTTGGTLHGWAFDPKHPEASLNALFRPVWYEGYPRPAHVWQSTGGSVDAEPKFGMVPLMFGTLKATFYAMLFGAPLALLAAIHTSEFLDRGTRAKLKPAIESMASLPSVVLGFLAALIFAPYLESRVPAVFAAAALVPTLLFLGAYLWQLLPARVAIRYSWLRFAAALATLPTALWLAGRLGPALERALFEGDLMRWLDGRRTAETFGGALGGWLVLCLPLCATATALAIHTFVSPGLVRRFGRSGRTRFAGIELAKFVAGVAATILLDVAVSSSLAGLGLDPRGPVFGAYSQRNALIVGFVMGFAIIPIIFTIADDALTSVPETLRSASLGAGATPWQTAIRIVIPAAMSGLFSALMIGLGRAVGETMIVLMAAGNTPVTEWNPFSGFRTLSANLAVELPDTVADSTHYRILFLAGLTLFILTFFVNTLAELVRLRFRRRMVQL